MLHDQQLTRDRLEAAMRDSPFCQACGAPTRIVDHDAVLWLECSTITEPRSRIGQALASIAPHERQLILDLRFEATAA